MKILNPSLSFNSTLVQLKADDEGGVDSDQSCFNSTLVQLKVVMDCLRPLVLPQFQFYLSSIKSFSLFQIALFGMKFQFYLSSIKSR